MSKSNGYQTVAQTKKKGGSSDVAQGKKKTWVEAKMTADIKAPSNRSVNGKIGTIVSGATV